MIDNLIEVGWIPSLIECVQILKKNIAQMCVQNVWQNTEHILAANYNRSRRTVHNELCEELRAVMIHLISCSSDAHGHCWLYRTKSTPCSEYRGRSIAIIKFNYLESIRTLYFYMCECYFGSNDHI